MSTWRAKRNERSLTRLHRALPDPFPAAVLAHALARPLVPPTPRLAVESYWRHHPIRADRLARALAARSGPPPGWRWTGEGSGPAGFRTPPTPFREKLHRRGPGHCCICGQPVYRLGWHADLWGADSPNRNAGWHSACVVAWKFWTAPSDFAPALKRLQNRRCPATGKRLLRSAEVDHRVPLHRVWHECREIPWPDLLRFWGVPNLQVIDRAAHAEKTAAEAGERARRR